MSNIESAYNIGDHQKLSNWTFSFNDEEDFEYRIRSVNLPFFTLTHESTTSGRKFYNGVQHVDTISLDMYETLDYRTKQKLDELRDQVFDIEQKVYKSNISPATAYPTGILTFYGEGDTITKVYKLERMRFLGIGEISLSYDDGGPLVYSVTFAIDNISEE